MHVTGIEKARNGLRGGVNLVLLGLLRRPRLGAQVAITKFYNMPTQVIVDTWITGEHKLLCCMKI